jgi:hypothetical protein
MGIIKLNRNYFKIKNNEKPSLNTKLKEFDINKKK